MRFSILFMPLLLGLLLAAPGLSHSAPTQIEGDFETIGPVPAPHSLSVVRMEEFLNFTCPHCNNFRDAAKPMFEKYGKRLQKVTVPVLFRGQSDAPLRLYFIGERAGRGPEVEALIFDATFRFGVNINDPSIVGYLARSAGLADKFREEANAPWVNEEIGKAQIRADEAGVEATPTIVLSGALRMVPRTGMQEYVNNLDHVIGQLLKQ